MSILSSKSPLMLILLILLPLKLANTLPLKPTAISQNANKSTDFEYYLNEFLRLYYNTHKAPSAELSALHYNKQKSSSNIKSDYDWWEMQGDQPATGGDATVLPGQGGTVMDVDRLNAIGVEDASAKGATGGSDGVPTVQDVSMEYLIKMRKRLNETGDVEERAKDNWIQLLKQNILKQVGWTNYSTDPNVDSLQNYPQAFQQSNRSSIMDLLRSNNEENGSKAIGVKFDGLVTEKIRSYYPQCDLPKGTDIDLWNDENILNLYYNNFDVSEGNVQTANLRLYRLLNDTSLADINCPEDAALEDDKILRVSAYWYLKPLKRQKAIKKRMCDSKVILERANWIELNVKPAMASWLRGRNAGLAIVVEDQDGGVLKANQYFIGPSCQAGGASTPKPIPSFILDALRQPYDPKASQNGPPHHQNSAHGLLGQGARATLAAHATLRLPSLDIKTSEMTTPQDPIPNPKHSDEDCESVEKHEVSQLDESVQLRHTRHHHRHQHHQRLEDHADPRSRMVATQIIWTSQQLMELQKAQQQKQKQLESDLVLR